MPYLARGGARSGRRSRRRAPSRCCCATASPRSPRWPTPRTTSTRRRTRRRSARRARQRRQSRRRWPSCSAEFATLDWTREALGAALKAAAARHGLKPPQVMMAMRVLVAGTRADAGDRRGARAARRATRARAARAGLAPLSRRSVARERPDGAFRARRDLARAGFG